MCKGKVGHNTGLAGRIITIVGRTQAIGPRRLESGVTHRDIERVRIVDDVEQIGHRRLAGSAAITNVERIGLGHAVAEAQSRRDVKNRARYEGVELTWTGVLHLRALRIERNTGMEANILRIISKIQIYAIVEVAVGGILAVV